VCYVMLAVFFDVRVTGMPSTGCTRTVLCVSCVLCDVSCVFCRSCDRYAIDWLYSDGIVRVLCVA